MSGGGSGGGGNQYYDNLNALYGQQTQQSKELMGMATSTVFPAYKELVQQAQDTGSQANQEKVAGEAVAQGNAATTTQEKALSDNLASYGINPGDARYAQAQKDIALGGAASTAGQATAARQQQRNLGFARLQDATSMGMGTPTQATAAASSAGMSAANAGNMWQSQQQMNANSVGSAVRGGLDLYGIYNNGHKDGGLITPIHLKGGGYVQRPLKLAGGGFIGGLQGIVPPMPPPSMPRQNISPLGAASGVARLAAPVAAGNGLGLQGNIARGIQGAGELSGSRDVTAFGNGMAVPQGADPAVKQFFISPDTIDYQMHATRAVDQALPDIVPGANGATAGAAGDAGASAAADLSVGGSEAAAGEAGSALGGAASALGTAVPFVGAGIAAYGIGKSLGWWADGGSVHPGSTGATGSVSGPGGPKDDLIPAMLSDGEFVMPVGAVKKFGLDRLNKMRMDGLEFEKQLGIR